MSSAFIICPPDRRGGSTRVLRQHPRLTTLDVYARGNAQVSPGERRRHPRAFARRFRTAARPVHAGYRSGRRTSAPERVASVYKFPAYLQAAAVIPDASIVSSGDTSLWGSAGDACEPRAT